MHGAGCSAGVNRHRLLDLNGPFAGATLCSPFKQGRQNNIKLLPHARKVLTSRKSDKRPWRAQKAEAHAARSASLVPFAHGPRQSDMPRLRAHHPRLPSGSAGMPARKPSCSTKPRHEQRLVRSRMGKPKATVIRGKPSPAGWPPCPAVPRDPSVWDPGVSPSRRLLTSFCCREGLPVGLVRRIAG